MYVNVPSLTQNTTKRTARLIIYLFVYLFPCSKIPGHKPWDTSLFCWQAIFVVSPPHPQCNVDFKQSCFATLFQHCFGLVEGGLENMNNASSLPKALPVWGVFLVSQELMTGIVDIVAMPNDKTEHPDVKVLSQFS